MFSWDLLDDTDSYNGGGGGQSKIDRSINTAIYTDIPTERTMICQRQRDHIASSGGRGQID